VTGFSTDTDHGRVQPRITGVLIEGGRTVRADLVVDCCGRRSALGAWLEAAGARRPIEEREDCGFVYYGRHYRSRTGEQPQALMNIVQNYNSLTVLTLPADNGTWSVVLATSSRDRELRRLRDPSTFDAALAQYPLAAPWAKGEPITGVDVMAGIEDRYRRLVVNGDPVATGVVAVGDAWACTNPSLGRGTSIGLHHARALRDMLREVDASEDEKLAHRFDELTTTAVEPLYRMTVWYDRHRLAEVQADIDGHPYETDDPRWSIGKATFAASLRDPEIARANQSLGSLLVTSSELFAEPGLVDRVMRLGSGAPTYPILGPDRRQLLSVVAS
jgi:2-polyprenyl-6-methoxyphenol hydroxylase-like FAD-dependent oxidoreductase